MWSGTLLCLLLVVAGVASLTDYRHRFDFHARPQHQKAHAIKAIHPAQPKKQLNRIEELVKSGGKTQDDFSYETYAPGSQTSAQPQPPAEETSPPYPYPTPAQSQAPAEETSAPYPYPTPAPAPDCGCTYNKIWLDVMLVLDSSSAMTKDGLDTLNNYILTAASKMSVGQQQAQVSRFGAIIYAGNASLINSLRDFNSIDDMYDNFNPQFSGEVGSNIEAAIRLASAEFETANHRANTKKVMIIAASHYEPGASNDPVQAAETFKGDGGIIITLEYVQTHGADVPILNQLATSACYQLTNRNGDLKANNLLDVLCKANCFCASQWYSYSNDQQCQTPQGGCFFPVAITSNQKLAERFCKNDKGGTLPKVTDANKAVFLASLTSNKQPTWLGLTWDGGAYEWIDGSYLGSYQPFDTIDYNKKCVVQQQGSGFRVGWSSADCMTEDYVYSCEASPCSSDKYCA